MCGIVGYIGPQNATPIILHGLKRLEYRGYESAGLAVIQNDRIEIRRDVGKLDKLNELVAEIPVSGHVGIGPQCHRNRSQAVRSPFYQG